MTKILSNKSNIDLDYPICRPSLDLDFTQERLDPRITFSRGSIGTRVNRNRLIETVGVNVPRFDYDPVTGECKGLLIEESRTNLLTYSSDFSQSVWTKTRSNILSNAAIAPDGTNTAFKLYNDTTVNASHRLTSTAVVTAGLALPTGSIFVKAAEYSRVLMSVIRDNGTAFAGLEVAFDLKTGTIITNLGYSGVTGRIEPYDNGWYRISVVSTVAATTNYAIRINLLNVFLSSAGTYSGDNTSGIYVWGAQLEAGSFPTSYIPTTASIVPRSADNAQMTGTNFSSWYNPTEGSLFVAARVNALGGSGYPGISYVDDGTTGNSMGFYVDDAGTDRIGAEAYVSGRLQYGFASSSATTANKLNKAISSYSINNFSGAFDTSGQVQRDTNGSIPTVDRLRIGAPRGNVYKLNGTISRLTYYPRALKPNQLQYLTQ